MTFSVQCRCGFGEENIANEKRAQIVADVHSGLAVRRPYQHNGWNPKCPTRRFVRLKQPPNDGRVNRSPAAKPPADLTQ